MRASIPSLLVLFAVLSPTALDVGAAASPGWTAGEDADEKRAKELLKEIRTRQGPPAKAPFEELGRMGNKVGLETLIKSLGVIRRRQAMPMLFDAVSSYSDVPELSDDALDFLAEQSESSRFPVAEAAPFRLKAFGEEGVERLLKIAASGRSEVGRASAVGALRDELRDAGDVASLEIILGAASVPQSGSADEVTALLRSFDSPEEFALMGRFLKGKKANEERSLLIIDSVGGFQTKGTPAIADGIALVLNSAVKAKSPSLQYAALAAASERGISLTGGAVKRLASSKDASVRKAALIAGMSGPLPIFKPQELSASKDALARQAAAIGLAARVNGGEAEALGFLHELLQDEDHFVRLSGVRAIKSVRSKESIPLLIGLLTGKNGRLGADAEGALRSITGRDYGSGAGAWERFWEAEGASFEVPTLETVRESELSEKLKGDKDSSRAAFYGIKIVSDRFALIVDTSGSMNEPAYGGKTRLDVAKRELGATLDRLGAGVLFNVIAFDAVERPMRPRMAKATQKNVKKANAYVDELTANGGTNIYAALKNAFEDEQIDTIYLLSDGDPSVGDIIDPRALRAEVARWNSARNVVINCIAIGAERSLLEGLAEDHGGQYITVE